MAAVFVVVVVQQPSPLLVCSLLVPKKERRTVILWSCSKWKVDRSSRMLGWTLPCRFVAAPRPTRSMRPRTMFRWRFRCDQSPSHACSPAARGLVLHASGPRPFVSVSSREIRNCHAASSAASHMMAKFAVLPVTVEAMVCEGKKLLGRVMTRRTALCILMRFLWRDGAYARASVTHQ
jgi:hypothetical protein